jgi:hypothetical protein
VAAQPGLSRSAQLHRPSYTELQGKFFYTLCTHFYRKWEYKENATTYAVSRAILGRLEAEPQAFRAKNNLLKSHITFYYTQELTGWGEGKNTEAFHN